MNILFAHQYFPGQFENIARHLAAAGHDVKAFTSGIIDGRNSPAIEGIEMIGFGHEVVIDRPEDHVLNDTESFIRHAASLALAADTLKQSGWLPHVVYSHTGWGVGAFLQDVFPDARFIKYCEWFYNTKGGDTDFFEPDPSIETRIVSSLLNLPVLSEFARADRMISPTEWQKSRFPEPLRQHITVVPDGIDMAVFAPDKAARFELDGGRTFVPGDRVVTYVARGADPYRGFATFIAALAMLQQRDKTVHALIAGDRKVYYGAGAGTETYFNEVMAEARLDPVRTHFLGRIDKRHYVRLLQVSAVHIYLTVPFVLSWSALEAMAAACLLIASDTAPVTEFIEDGVNGLLCHYNDADHLAGLMERALDGGPDLDRMRRAARDRIAERWSHDFAINRHLALLDGLSAKL